MALIKSSKAAPAVVDKNYYGAYSSTAARFTVMHDGEIKYGETITFGDVTFTWTAANSATVSVAGTLTTSGRPTGAAITAGGHIDQNSNSDSMGFLFVAD